MTIVDIQLDSAYFCVECDVITNACDRCKRCGGDLVPIRQWITRIDDAVAKRPVPVLSTGFFIMIGVIDHDSDGDGYVLKETKDHPGPYVSCAGAQAMIKRLAPHAQPEIDSMWARNPAVKSVWRVDSTIICVVER